MRVLGKTLQFVGLTLPLVSILAQLSNAITTKQMLLFLVAAASAFWLGRILEGYAR